MNVALVRLSALGDVVHALPVAAALRRSLPQARIVWLAERREAALLRANPAVDAVVPVDTRGWRRARSVRALVREAGAVSALVQHLREERLDVAIDLQGNAKSGLVTAATRAPLRIGFVAAWCREPVNALFTNLRIRPPREARHVVEQCLALVEPLGARPATVEFPLPFDPEAEGRVDDFLRGAGLKPRQRLVVLNPGAGRAAKRWPLDRFGQLAGRLAEEARAAVLVVWGPGEEEAAATIAGMSPRGGVLAAPPTGLAELLAVLRRASVVVAADTGPIHLAAALGTPCVGLYGPTSSERNGPWGQIGSVLACPDGKVESLHVPRVYRAVLGALERDGA